MQQFFKLRIAKRRAPHPDTQPIEAFSIMPGQDTSVAAYHQARAGSGGWLTLSGKHHWHDDDAKRGVNKGGVLLVKHQICSILQA